MTPRELIDVNEIKTELDNFIELVEKLNDRPLDAVLGGSSVGPSTELEAFKAALILRAENARDSKQAEFDTFVGTNV